MTIIINTQSSIDIRRLLRVLSLFLPGSTVTIGDYTETLPIYKLVSTPNTTWYQVAKLHDMQEAQQELDERDGGLLYADATAERSVDEVPGAEVCEAPWEW